MIGHEVDASDMRYVRGIVRRWANVRGIRESERDDFEGDALLELVLLAEEFDSERGVPFHKFLSSRIPWRLIDALRRTGYYGRSGHLDEKWAVAHPVGYQPAAREREDGTVTFSPDVFGGQIADDDDDFDAVEFEDMLDHADLSPKHRFVADGLAEGARSVELAEALGVTGSAVTQWKHRIGWLLSQEFHSAA